MNVSALMTSCGAVFMLSLTSAGLVASSAAPASATEFQQTNLVSDIPGLAAITDPNLVNAWGISESSMSPFWISDNGTGVSTLYAVPGATPPVQKLGLTVTIPGGSPTSAPTGQVFNTTAGFSLGASGKALFIFDSEDGVISGWNGSLGTNAIVTVPNTTGAVYKGLAISNLTPALGAALYATDFHNGSIDVFDSSFTSVTLPGTFTDPNLPLGYAPFNDAVLNGQLYVTFAKQDGARHDDVAGPGNGFVDVFDLYGNLISRLISNGALNSPWGLALAPAGFGSLGGDLLVGNFGDGTINAYDPTTGAFKGTLDEINGQPLMIDGLWGLIFGNGAAGGSPGTLYFTAGLNDEADGLFGSLTAVPEPSTWAMLLAGFGGLGFAALRRRRCSSVSGARPEVARAGI